jgi:hypothetical protein
MAPHDFHQTQTVTVVWSHPISMNWPFDEPRNVRSLAVVLADTRVDNRNEACLQAVGGRRHTDVMDALKLLFAMEREKGQSQQIFSVSRKFQPVSVLSMFRLPLPLNLLPQVQLLSLERLTF